MMRWNRKGQSTAEYAVLIALVVGAVVAMQTYVKRGIQGKIAGAVNSVQIPGVIAPNQYEPYYASSDYNVNQDQQLHETYNAGDVTHDGHQNVTRTGAQTEGGADTLNAANGWTNQ